MTPLPEIEITPRLLAVYRNIVDGRGPGAGFSIRETAQDLKVSEETIRQYVKGLEAESYILRIPGTKRPGFWKRGPKSNLLDKARIGFESKIDSGTVKANPISTPESNPTQPVVVNVPTARTHINGRVVFEVLRIGDMHNIVVPEALKEGPMGSVIPDGSKKRTYPLFPKEPNRDHHNTRSWRCKVPYDGYEVSIELWETGEHAQLFVWPPQLELVPEQFCQAESMMITRAQQVVNLLAKYGKWQFGVINFKGDIEFASTDDRLISQIPEDMRSLPGSDLYVDGSKGKGKKAAGPEIETKNPETAKLVFDFPTTIRNLVSTQEKLGATQEKLEGLQQSQTSRIYVVEMTAEKLLRVAEMLLEMKTMEMERDVSQHLQDETNKRKATIPDEEVASARTPYDGVMFQ